jgi:hypothetical protein
MQKRLPGSCSWMCTLLLLVQMDTDVQCNDKQHGQFPQISNHAHEKSRAGARVAWGS